METTAIIDTHATVSVSFAQHGTWGGCGFLGTLSWASLGCPDMSCAFGLTPCTHDANHYEPILTINEPADYAGLQLRNGKTEIPGQYGKGYNHPLSGKFYRGNLQVGDTPLDIRSTNILPPAIYPSTPNCLHIEEGDVATPAQRQLLLEAVRFDRADRFSFGLTIGEIFPQADLEGSKAGQIYYA